MIKHPLSSEVDRAGKQIKATLKALAQFCETAQLQVVCIPPNSDPGSFEMKAILQQYAKSDWLIATGTLTRSEFVNLMRHTKVLVGNSSMGILEAPHYKLPVVNVGNRQLGRLNAGNVEFVTYDQDQINQSLEKAVFDEGYRQKVKDLVNPYGDGSSIKKIREALESVDLSGEKWHTKRKLC